jgi:mRNA interferase MazF
MRRPVVVIQSNAFNDSAISTVVVATITSNLALSAAPGNVRISKSVSGLGKVSVINVSQVLTLDQNYLTTRIKALPTSTLNEVNSGLSLCLGL